MASIAIALGAIVPGVSMALQAKGTEVPWGSICSSVPDARRGADQQSETQRQGTVPTSAHLFEHCPYCGLHAATLGMPPNASTAAALSLSFLLSHLDFASAPSLRVWSEAQSQAPPKFR